MDEYYGYQAGPTRRQMLARIIIGGVAAFLIIAFLIWFLFLRNPNEAKTGNATKSTESSQSSNSGTGSNSSGSGSTGPGSSSNSTSGKSGSGSSTTNKPSTSGSSGSSTQPSTSSSSTSTNGTASGDLSKTGPGDVVAIFVGAVIVGTAFRRYQLAKR